MKEEIKPIQNINEFEEKETIIEGSDIKNSDELETESEQGLESDYDYSKFTGPYIGEYENNYYRSHKEQVQDIRKEYEDLYVSGQPWRNKWKKDYSIDDEIFHDLQQRLFSSILEDFLRKNRLDLEFFRKIRSFIFNLDSEGLDDFESCLLWQSEIKEEMFFLIQNFDSHIVRKVFNKISKLNHLRWTLMEDFIKNEFDSKITDSYKIRNLVDLGIKNILLKFIDTFKTTKEQGLELSLEEMEQKLEQIKTDTILLTSTLRSMKKKGEKISLDDIKNISLKGHIPATEITNTDMVAMTSLYQENYKQYPELTKVLIESLDKSFNSADSEFSILSYKGEIIGFYRIDHPQEPTVHFASFNIDTEFQGAGLGEAMMFKDLDIVAEEKIILAECNPNSAIGQKYIERGFVGISSGQIGEIQTLNIIRNDKETFQTKEPNKKQEDFVKEMLESELTNSEGICDKGEYFIAKASNPADIDFKSFLSGGNVLTRYFIHKYFFAYPFSDMKEYKEWYAVFEKGNLSQ